MSIVSDITSCLGFYTRLPVAGRGEPERFAEAQWAAPVAGWAVAAVASVVFLAANLFGLLSFISAILAVAAMMIVTGGLHEDGLADTADGFGGGSDRERKLEIMRDSRSGSYGVAALVFSILLRVAAVAAIAQPLAVAAALFASAAAGRALMPAFMHFVPPARPDGLSAGVGTVSRDTALRAAVIGAVTLLLLGLPAAIVAAILLVLWAMVFKALCERQIGGQTGDTLGSLEQGGEIVVLLVAASIL